MDIAHFDDLLRLARPQREPQVLLFVFASAGLPADASHSQRVQHDSGVGGELTPLMCVDKTPAALTDFETLCAEAEVAGPPWAIVFSAALSGRNGQPPT
ncbi:MAG: ribonucleotide reductase subunit alpha, partial [Rubrivivax sp.]|nr:ribonucleotide reductase subunit alpha [Rubrivivax sp.]